MSEKQKSARPELEGMVNHPAPPAGEEVWVQGGKVYRYRPELELDEERRAGREGTIALRGHRAKYQPPRVEKADGGRIFHPARVLNLDGGEVYFRPGHDGLPADVTPIDTAHWGVSGHALLREVDALEARVDPGWHYEPLAQSIRDSLEAIRTNIRRLAQQFLEHRYPSVRDDGGQRLALRLDLPEDVTMELRRCLEEMARQYCIDHHNVEKDRGRIDRDTRLKPILS